MIMRFDLLSKRNVRHKTRTYNSAAQSISFCVAKVGCAIAIGASSWLPTAVPALSQAETLSADQLFQLCSRYPYNTQCEGYEAPVSLNQREGDIGICAINTDGVAIADQCKIKTTDTQIAVYVEQGDSMSLLDGKRPTTVFTIDLATINRLTYREDESVNQGRIITNTLLFGVWGTLLTQPDKVSQIEIQFADNTETANNTATPVNADNAALSSEQTTEPTAAPAENANTVPTQNLVFESGRQEGRALRESLEQLTGLTALAGL